MDENKKTSLFDKLFRIFIWIIFLIPILMVITLVILLPLNAYNYYFSETYVDEDSINYSIGDENDLWNSESNKENRMRLESIAVSNLITNGSCSDYTRPMTYTVRRDFLSSILGGSEEVIEYCENDQEFIVTFGGYAPHSYFFQGSPFKN